MNNRFNVSIEDLVFLRQQKITGVAQLAVLLSLDGTKTFGDASNDAGVSLRCVELLIARKNPNFRQVKFKPGPDFAPKGRHPSKAIKRTAKGERLYQRLVQGE